MAYVGGLRKLPVTYKYFFVKISNTVYSIKVRFPISDIALSKWRKHGWFIKGRVETRGGTKGFPIDQCSLGGLFTLCSYIFPPVD